MAMQTISKVSDLRSALAQLCDAGHHMSETQREASGEPGRKMQIALVPTMGALHAGHIALVEYARRIADHVVVSIFVNPSQFGPNEDFSRYPRQEAQDAAMLEAAEVNIVWLPDVATMYPAGYPDGDATQISVSGVSAGLDGVARPGHFTGVATVVAKLFLQVQPDIAIFGEKDFQQLAVIRAMVRDLAFPIQIIGAPTVRDADGLALSSRNAYLSPAERAAATAIPRLCQACVAAITSGADIISSLDTVRTGLITSGFDTPDYVALCDAETLQPITRLDREARLFVAARIGKTRLIDNFHVKSLSSTKNY